MLRKATSHVSPRFVRNLERTDSSAVLAAVILLCGYQAEASGSIQPPIPSRPDPIVQQQSFDYLGPSGGRTSTFVQFDDLGGARRLVDVVLELVDTSTWVFHVQVQNNAPVDNSVTLELHSDVLAVAPSNLTTTVELSAAETAVIEPLLTYDFGDLNDSGSSSANLAAMANPNYTPYIGQGTINIDVSNVAGLDVTCSVPNCGSTISISHDQWRILAGLRLTYVYVDSPTSIDPQDFAQRGFALGTPRPNPWRGDVVLHLPVYTPQGADVEIEMYDVAGRRVAHRTRMWLDAGDHLIPWLPPRLAAGIYTVRLRATAGATSTARWTVLR